MFPLPSGLNNRLWDNPEAEKPCAVLTAMQIIDKSNSVLVLDYPRVSVLSEGQREGRLGERDCMLLSWQCTSPHSLPVHLITLYTKFPSFLFLHVNRFGPLVRSWCMRYEAKHHYFKRLAIVIGNFINVSFSLAKRHQEGVCYRLQSAEGGASSFIDKGVEIGPGKKIYVY